MDSEFAGLLVAVGFVVMGLVSLPIAKWFLLGALLFGGRSGTAAAPYQEGMRLTHSWLSYKGAADRQCRFPTMLC